MSKVARIARTIRAFTRELSRPASEHIINPAPEKRPRIGIALGGGFARAVAHIGVLKALEEENIPIDFVSGTSAGAVIGAGYCSRISAAEIEDFAQQARFRDFARWTLSRFGVCSNDRMSRLLEKLVLARSFEELKIPLAVSATDFATGEGVMFSAGPLLDAIRASCAYPGMFLPVSVGGKLFVDGLLGHPVPTQALRKMGADRVIAVYLSGHWVNSRGPRHVFEVLGQCFSIAQEKMRAAWQAEADLVLEPNVAGFAFDGFEHSTELVRRGYEAARAAMPKILAWLGTTEPADAGLPMPTIELANPLGGAAMPVAPLVAK